MSALGHVWTYMDPARLQQADWIGCNSHNCWRISGFLMRPENSAPRAPMDFRVLPPQRRPDIGLCHAGPHTRFGKQRSDRFTISCHL